tara:strand:+ start:339 stop:737 length:399 start_codon:yes stop_codon:yes gene_type:complete
MKNLMDKLTTYASLVGVVTAIGGGFYAWGEFNTRLSAIEGSGVDISGISKNAEDIAVINEKINELDLSEIAVVKKLSEDNEEWIEEIEKKVGKNKDGIAEAEKKATVNEKTIQLFKLEIEELKLKAKNPLAN